MNTMPSGPGPQQPAGGLLAPPVEPDEIGRLAHYRVLRELGRGGMGAVFLAEDALLTRRVALKVMLPAVAARDDARARFLREGRAVAALKHDHIVTVYGAGEENGVPYLAMELLAGQTLDDWLRPDRRATPAQVLAIGRQIAEGLAAAHAAGLVHRDVKPANVWLEAPTGRVKLLDFGLARPGGGDPGLTESGAILGTPAYMSPEQARGRPVDHRCDLFSLGCVLYRMATGRVPFQGDSAYAVIVAVASEEPAAPRAVNPDVPPALEALIQSLLAKEPGDRPASAAEVAAALDRVAAELPARADPPARTADWTGRHAPAGGRSLRVVAAVAAAVAVVALVVVLVLGRKGEPRTAEGGGETDATTKAGGTGKSDDPDDPAPTGKSEPAPKLSVVGAWDQMPPKGGKPIRYVFQANHGVSGENGYVGRWDQSGRKVTVFGHIPRVNPDKNHRRGEIDPTGKVLRLITDKEKTEVYTRP